MYRPKNATLASTTNPLVRHAKTFIRNLPRQKRIVFLLKYIKYSLDTRDIEAAQEGLHHLCISIPELKNDLIIANRTYLGDDEGERLYMLFKHAFGKVKNGGKKAIWQRRKRQRSTSPLFS